eukprot:435206_1
MFRSDRDQAIGVYNDVITIIGGYIYGYQITEYNITNNSMHFLGETANLYDVYTVDSGFTQINDLLYIIQYYNGYGQQISVYNLATKIFHNDVNITIPLPVQWTACLTNYIDEYLFVLGGYYGAKRKNFQIYNMTNFEWFTGPEMLRERSTLTCAVHKTLQKLYAIGGTGRTIEIISIENMHNLTYPGWYYNDPISLLDGAGNLMRSIVYENSIFIIGGVDAEDKVQRIDCISGNISIAGYLSYPQYSGAVIVYNSIIYAFSGYYSRPSPSPFIPPSPIYYDIWQYTEMTPRPTVAPTNITNVPTTYEPTISTDKPTYVPSYSPTTNEPTSTPTNNASNNPSEYPSLNPSLVPTKNPTMTPTLYPTYEPTIPFTSTMIVSDRTTETTISQTTTTDGFDGSSAESGNIMYSILMNICIIISIVLFV